MRVTSLYKCLIFNNLFQQSWTFIRFSRIYTILKSAIFFIRLEVVGYFQWKFQKQIEQKEATFCYLPSWEYGDLKFLNVILDSSRFLVFIGKL